MQVSHTAMAGLVAASSRGPAKRPITAESIKESAGEASQIALEKAVISSNIKNEKLCNIPSVDALYRNIVFARPVVLVAKIVFLSTNFATYKSRCLYL